MLIVVLSALILLMLLPLLAEVRMVIRAILAGSIGQKAAQQVLKELPFAGRVTLLGVKAHLRSLHREYGQYMRLQGLCVLAAAVAIALVALFVGLRLAIPAVAVSILFCVAAFGGISLVHAHAGYDPEKHTTRFDR